MHKHAKIIMEWAQMMQLPESEWRTLQSDVNHGDGFLDLDCKKHSPSWDCSYDYRWKPRTIRIGDIDVPEPMRQPLEEAQSFYYPSLVGCSAHSEMWLGDGRNLAMLERGLVHLDKESAALHAKAILSLTQKKE